MNKNKKLGELSDIDIKQICKKIGLKLVGVFSKDQIPKKFKDGNYIINMQDHNKGENSHWISCVNSKGNKANIYFDSFGVIPPKEVEDAMSKQGFYFSVKQVQGYNSSNCGWHCIHVLKLLQDGYNFNDIINSFGKNKKENDKILENYFIGIH
jgi:hypothetical protein